MALLRIKPSDAPNDQTTLENFLSNLASEARVAKVIFAGANALVEVELWDGKIEHMSEAFATASPAAQAIITQRFSELAPAT